VPARYEIRTAGQLDQNTSAAFAGFDVTTRGNLSVVCGEFDQAGVNGLLDRIRFFGLDLVDARRVRGPSAHRPA
jgi:hypothetical protein